MSTGTGKSLLLRAIITALRKKNSKKPEVVSVTASTGMAASNIGGNAPLSARPSVRSLRLAHRDYNSRMGSHYSWDARHRQADQLHQDMQTRPPALEVDEGSHHRRGYALYSIGRFALGLIEPQFPWWTGNSLTRSPLSPWNFGRKPIGLSEASR